MVDKVHTNIALPGYTVLECLAEDPCGMELKARADLTGRLVAIHVYPGASDEVREAFRRFASHFKPLRDAFKFEHLLEVREIGARDDFCYCVSDYVEGYDVADWLRRKGMLDESDVMLVGQYAVVALAHLWNSGRIVHGDLKLTDLLVAPGGEVKLRCFSTYESVMVAAHHPSLARPKGPYVAPEVRRGDSTPTPQSDMYSLGMILLHLLTGACPPPDLVPVAPGNAANMLLSDAISVSRPLTMLVRKLTAADPLARYRGWSDLLADIALIEQGSSPVVAPAPLSATVGSGDKGLRPHGRAPRRRARRLVLPACLALICGAVVSYRLAFRGDSIPLRPKECSLPQAVPRERAIRPRHGEPPPRADDGPPVTIQEPVEGAVDETDDPPETPPEAVPTDANEVAVAPVAAPAWHVPAEYPEEGVEDYVLIMHDVMRLGAKRRFEEARMMLDQWLVINGENPYGEHVEDEKRRLDITQAAFERVLASRMLVKGVSIEAQPGLCGAVTDVRDGQLWVALKYEQGELEVAIPLSEVTEHDLSTLLRRCSPTTYAEDMALYLAAGGQVDALDALIAKEQIDEPLLDHLRKLAHGRHFVVDNLQALDTLARIGHLVDAGLFEDARTALTDARAKYAVTVVFSRLRTDELGRLDRQIAEGLAELEEVFAAATEFSVATLSKPDRQARLRETFETAIAKGRWQEYVGFLESALLNALRTKASFSRKRQYERVLEEAVMRNALNRAAFVHTVAPGKLAEFVAGDPERAFVRWLLGNDRALDAFLSTVKPEDDLLRVLGIWRDLWQRDPRTRDTYFNLALAFGVVFDNPVPMPAEADSGGAMPALSRYMAKCRARYEFFRRADVKKQLRVQLAKMPARELIWVVDVSAPDSELRWAQTHVNYSRRDWGRAYGRVPYRMDKARGELEEPLYSEYTLEEIRKRGGVCADQAYFCVVSAKANGIPAMIISGDGSRGPHAWVGYKASEKEWILDAGRYEGYASGTTRDPQTGRMIKPTELSVAADSRARATSLEKANRCLRLAGLFVRHSRIDEARQAFRMALDVGSRQIRVWDAYVAFLRQMNVDPDEWEEVIGELRQSFRDYPDMLAYADGLEEEMLFPLMDSADIAKALRSRIGRIDHSQGDRTDLLRENIRRHVRVLEWDGDVDGVIRVYEDALDDLRGDKVSFQELSNDLFAFAKRYGKHHDAMRIIDRAFRRGFRGSYGDYFYMREYRNMLYWLADLHEKDGDESKADRYRRDAERLGRRL